MSTYSVTDLDNFPVLKSIGGAFSVYNNRKLTDLGDFPNLTSIGKSRINVNSERWYIDNVSIVVERNPNLVLCSWLQDFLAGGEHAVSGEIFINDNAIVCNSGNEIMAPAPADTMTLPLADTMTIPPADTTIALSTHTKESLFTLYPNPTKGALTIEGVTGYLQIFIHDLVGTEVMTYLLTSSKKTIDVSNIPSGMYVVTLQGEDKTWTEVLIIVN